MERSSKKHIITIGGELGSGKSSTAKLLAQTLGYKHYSAGDLMRQLGRERGIEDIREFNRISEGSDDVDFLVDERTKKIGREQDNVVFDGHMAGMMLPQSFRVYLVLDYRAAAERILSGISPERRVSEHIPEDPDEYMNVLLERQESNVRRYQATYGINPYDPSLYDFVVNTGTLNLEEAVLAIRSAFDDWIAAG